MTGLLARLGRVWALLRDPRTPRLPRLAVGLAVVYLLWPADLVPDLLVPVIGYLDDAVLLWVTTRWLSHSAPPPDAEPLNELPRGR